MHPIVGKLTLLIVRKMKPVPLKNMLLLLSTLFVVICSNAMNSAKMPVTGIYDGKIGKNKVILVIETSNEITAKGYYIHVRNNPVEKAHQLNIVLFNKQLEWASDEFSGIFNGKTTSTGITGSFRDESKKFNWLFWKKKKYVQLAKRFDFRLPSMDRYRYEIFRTYHRQENIVYGKAGGYWTETPYLDDPYIEILGKGMVNLFKGEKELDLKMDIYQPDGDTHPLRPLVLLIHGGAFYIGNKQSPTEEIIANKLTKLGYVVASMDYRMGFKLSAEEIERSGYKAIQDAHAALRFLASKARELRIDPTQVYVAGTSAGAMAALHVAFLDNDERPASTYGDRKTPDLGDIEKSGNKLKDHFEVKAVTNLWGAVLDIGIIDPHERIPVLSVHGTKDDIVPIDYSHPFKNTMMINRLIMNKVYGSSPIHERLNQFGIENKLIVLEGMGHEPQLDNFKSINSTLNQILDEMVVFYYQLTQSPGTEVPTELVVLKNDKGIQDAWKNENDDFSYYEPSGGLKISSNPGERKIIWIEDFPEHQLNVYSQNRFDAWSKQTVKVTISK
jgi:pimeloyl-ACP methyl ester carboxylesterase